jgi:hypothetical protein
MRTGGDVRAGQRAPLAGVPGELCACGVAWG